MIIQSCAKIIVIIVAASLISTSIQFSHAQGQIQSTNLLDRGHIWKPVGSAKVSQSDVGLLLQVTTGSTGKTFNRAILQTKIPQLLVPYHLELVYSTSNTGNASYTMEIRDTTTNNKVIWSANLGKSVDLNHQLFLLPPALANKIVEFRIYVITEGSGTDTIYVKTATLSPTYTS